MNDESLRALSLSRPWPWTFFHCGKRVENRSRNIGRYRGWCLMHAAQSDDWGGATSTVRSVCGDGVANGMPYIARHPTGYVGLMEVVDMLRPEDVRTNALLHQIEWDMRWRFEGSFAYLIGDVIELAKPIGGRGAMGFFRAPRDITRVIADDDALVHRPDVRRLLV